MKGVSVIVCCFNSEKRIAKTLEYLARQQDDKQFIWELIIVNNNCTDNTIQLIKSVWSELRKDICMKIVDELVPGLSAARLSGAREAKYQYLVFCDDDNWLVFDYLLNVFKIFESSITIGIVGGQSVAVTDDDVNLPTWFENEKNSFAVGKQLEKTGDASARKYVWGAGMAIRKRLCERAFSIEQSFLSDRKGNELLSGGDSELCARVLIMGYSLYYDERLIFKHYIPSSRLTNDYFNRLTEGHSLAFIILEQYWNFIQISNKPFFKRMSLLIYYSLQLIRKGLRKNLGNPDYFLFMQLCLRCFPKTQNSLYPKLQKMAVELNNRYYNVLS